jgi:hypothetical protein
MSLASLTRLSGVPPGDTNTTVMLIHGDTVVATWILPSGDRPDLSVVDDLARLQLAARRIGCLIRLRPASGDLGELLALAGLDQVLLIDLPVEMAGAPEGGEKVGAEEVVPPVDPIA